MVAIIYSYRTKTNIKRKENAMVMNKLFGKGSLNTEDRPEWGAMKPTKHDKERWSRGGMLAYLSADKKINGMNVVCLACRTEFVGIDNALGHDCGQEDRFRSVTGRVSGATIRKRPRHYKKRVKPAAESVTEINGVAEFVKGVKGVVEQRDLLLIENQRLSKENKELMEQTEGIRSIMDALSSS